jgi:predicted DNA-binding helix-hairpin-helix protein
MATNNRANDQYSDVYVGILQITKALGISKEQKATTKVTLEAMPDTSKKGIEIARLYQLSAVKAHLNLTLDKVEKIKAIASAKSPTKLKEELNKLRQQKIEIDNRIKDIEKELLA